MYDWLLFLHLLSAFVLVAGFTTLWTLVLAPSGAAAGRFAGPVGALTSAGATGTLVFGVWLAIYLDGYQLWDGWIVGSLVLWVVATGTGARAGGGPFSADATARQRGLLLQAVSTVATLSILLLMIYKPGA